jgi:predicted RND superfamily exporter protein
MIAVVLLIAAGLGLDWLTLVMLATLGVPIAWPLALTVGVAVGVALADGIHQLLELEQ